MNVFDVHALAYVLHVIGQSEIAFTMMKVAGLGNKPPEEWNLEKANKALTFANNFFYLYPVERCAEAVTQATKQFERPLIDNSAACEIFHRLQADIVSALKSKMFLRIANDRSEFVDKDRLFGDKVYDAYPSARGDIEEAGNCLAAECNTGAVFHLMRASEVALRAVANDRRVAFANKPLSQQEWGTILGALEGILKQMRLDDGKRWAKAEFKEAQIRFYNDVVQELRAFNEVWRRHLSHADEGAFYDRDPSEEHIESRAIVHAKVVNTYIGKHIHARILEY